MISLFVSQRQWTEYGRFWLTSVERVDVLDAVPLLPSLSHPFSSPSLLVLFLLSFFFIY
jgi:hypothetical protein